MPIHECKTFPNETSANAALNAAKATWTPPAYVHVGGGRHVDNATLPAQVLSLPIELVNGRFAVIANHPGFKGEFVDPDADFKRPAGLPFAAQTQKAKTK